jgi:hypothetical protein
MEAQPSYPVPETDQALLDTQTADWNLEQDIRILRFYIAKETQSGGNANHIAMLAKAVESLIRTNVSTALRTGEWMSRQTAREFALGLVDDVSDLIKPHVPDPEVYADLIQELKARLLERASREAVARANQRNEQL